MNDLSERDRADLQMLFDRREADVLLPQRAPAPVLRRARRREARFIVVGMLGAVAILASSIVGVGLMRNDERIPRPASVPVVEPSSNTRLTTLQFATLDQPDNWSVLDAGATFQLTNFDPNFDATWCTDGGAAIPDEGVLLRVSHPVDPATGSAPWPVSLSSRADGTIAGRCSPGAGVMEAAWTTPSGATYQAVAAIGASATTASRNALTAAFEGLAFPATDAPQIEGFSGVGSVLILASGVRDGVPWNLAAYQDRGRPWLGVASGMLPGEGSPLTGYPGYELHVDPFHLARTAFSGSVGLVFYGRASADVDRVDLIGSDGTSTPARFIPAPPSLGIDARIVFGETSDQVDTVTAVGFDAAGKMLDHPFIQTGPWVEVGTGIEPGVGMWRYSVAPANSGASDRFDWGPGRLFGGGSSLFTPLPSEAGSFSNVEWSSASDAEGWSRPLAMTATVSDQAERVVFVPTEGALIEGLVFRMPPDLIGPAKACVLIMPGVTGPRRGTLIAYDGSGAEIARWEFGH